MDMWMLLAPRPEELTFRTSKPEVYVLLTGEDMKTPLTVDANFLNYSKNDKVLKGH